MNDGSEAQTEAFPLHVPRGSADVARVAQVGRVRDLQSDVAGVAVVVVAVEDGVVGIAVRANVSDFDADGSRVGSAGMKRSLLLEGMRKSGNRIDLFEKYSDLQVQSLINGAIYIEHEVNAQATIVVQHLEGSARVRSDIVMQNKLPTMERETEKLHQSQKD